MKKTLEERVKWKLMNIGKQNRGLKILIFPALLLCVSFFHFREYCRGNVKRFAMIAITLIMFPVYSSFSFPIFITGVKTDNHSLDVDGAEDIALVAETEVDMDEVELLDDDDVLDEFEYMTTSHGYEIIDKYDASEILESTGVRAGKEDNHLANNTPPQTVFAADDWRLVLINKQNSIPDDYTFSLGTIKGNMQCDERIIDDLLNMLQAASEDGVGLIICSPYRDMERQEMLFNRKIDRYMNRGMSYMEAYRLSSEAVTVPGASEHQIGLSLDIICGEYTTLDAGFGETEAGKWLAEHSCEYGFILRYPLGKEYITGIEYEPWHFRYVGAEAATVITEEGITLEEFWEDYVN